MATVTVVRKREGKEIVGVFSEYDKAIEYCEKHDPCDGTSGDEDLQAKDFELDGLVEPEDRRELIPGHPRNPMPEPTTRDKELAEPNDHYFKIAAKVVDVCADGIGNIDAEDVIVEAVAQILADEREKYEERITKLKETQMELYATIEGLGGNENE